MRVKRRKEGFKPMPPPEEIDAMVTELYQNLLDDSKFLGGTNRTAAHLAVREQLHRNGYRHA